MVALKAMNTGAVETHLVVTNLCVDRSLRLMRWWEVVSNVVPNGGSSRGRLSPVKHPAPPAPQPLIRVLPPAPRFYCTIVQLCIARLRCIAVAGGWVNPLDDIGNHLMALTEMAPT